MSFVYSGSITDRTGFDFTHTHTLEHAKIQLIIALFHNKFYNVLHNNDLFEFFEYSRYTRDMSDYPKIEIFADNSKL